MESTSDIFARSPGPLADSGQRGMSRLIAETSGACRMRESGTSRDAVGFYDSAAIRNAMAPVAHSRRVGQQGRLQKTRRGALGRVAGAGDGERARPWCRRPFLELAAEVATVGPSLRTRRPRSRRWRRLVEPGRVRATRGTRANRGVDPAKKDRRPPPALQLTNQPEEQSNSRTVPETPDFQ